jgi:hypothetical protein
MHGDYWVWFPSSKRLKEHSTFQEGTKMRARFWDRQGQELNEAIICVSDEATGRGVVDAEVLVVRADLEGKTHRTVSGPYGRTRIRVAAGSYHITATAGKTQTQVVQRITRGNIDHPVVVHLNTGEALRLSDERCADSHGQLRASPARRYVATLGHLRNWQVLELRAILEILRGRLAVVDLFENMVRNDAPETALSVSA